MHDVSFTHRDPLYRIGLHILAADAMHLSASAPTPEISNGFFWLAGELMRASRLDDAGLVRRYDELLGETTGSVNVAAMDAMALIDLVLDTGPMPAVTP